VLLIPIRAIGCENATETQAAVGTEVVFLYFCLFRVGLPSLVTVSIAIERLRYRRRIRSSRIITAAGGKGGEGGGENLLTTVVKLVRFCKKLY
jgi:hypothetical protein